MKKYIFFTKFFKANSVNKLHAFGLNIQQDEDAILDTLFTIVEKVFNLDNPDKTVELVNVLIFLVFDY